jgi:hypothetical protein
MRGKQKTKRDDRTIQVILQLHVDSCQSMYDTYKRVGDMDGCRYEQGKIDGLERAIEVADNMAARKIGPRPSRRKKVVNGK